MAQVTVRAPSHVQSLLRYSYPITVRFAHGDEVALTRFYSDFVQLRADLITKSSRRNVPALPPREWDGYASVRERRRVAFEYFLNWCVANAAADLYVLDFFKLQSLSPIVHPQPAVLTGISPTGSVNDQSLIKVLFFGFLWLIAWQAMSREQLQHVSDIGNVPKAAADTGIVFTSEDYIDYVHAPPPGYLSRETKIVQDESGRITERSVHDEFLEYLENNSIRLTTIDTVVTVDQIGVEAAAQEVERVNELVSPLETFHIAKDEKDAHPTPVQDGLAENQIMPSAAEETEPAIVEQPAKPYVVEVVEDVIDEPAEGKLHEEEQREPNESMEQLGDNLSVERQFAAFLKLNTTRGQEEEDAFKAARKKELEFFFTPFHGVVAFIALYVLVIVWTKFFPASSTLEEVEFASDSDSDSAKHQSQALQQTVKQQIKVEPMGFTEAKHVFSGLRLTERETQLGSSLLARACGADSSVLINKSLSHLWDEASILSEEEARQRFVAFVVSRVRVNANASSEGEEEEEADGDDERAERSSVLATSMQSAFGAYRAKQQQQPLIVGSSDVSRRTTPEDSPSSRTSAVKWWDGNKDSATSPLKAAQSVAQSSPIPVVEASSMAISSFDSTDVSSLSMSPSPVKAGPLNHRKLDQPKEAPLRKVADEFKVELAGKASTTEFAMGALLGLAGAVVVSTTARRAIAAFRG